MKTRIFSVMAFIVLSCFILPACQQQKTNPIIEQSGIQGGLIVHVGCGTGEKTASLLLNDRYRIQGLDTRAENVKKARETIRSKELYGKISISQLNGNQLPYIDNLVNLLVVEKPGNITNDEMLRVLCPNGVAMIKQNGQWKKIVKPRSSDMDDWTHYLHDASNNPVANDIRVDQPEHLQWIGGPKWSRHHDHMASMSALVSSNGRIFYIIDEGSKASVQLPPEWVLVARDAFNGVTLWKTPIQNWYNHLWPLKSGHAQLPRRLVAVGDKVYCTLGINAPLSQLDAATGEILQTFGDTKTVEEILYSDDKLLLVVNPNRQPVTYAQEDPNCWKERDRASYRWGWDETPRKLMTVDPQTGECIWQKESKIVPLTLASNGKNMVFHDGEALVCLNQVSGEAVWRSEPIERQSKIPTGWLPSLRYVKDVILFSGKKRAIIAVSADDGRVLWNSELHPSGHFSPEDMFVINDLVWSGDIANTNRTTRRNHSTGLFTGRDLHTGEIKKEFPYNAGSAFFMHQRCYPSKATQKFLIPSWTGTEFINLETEHWDLNHWVRGGCVYGIMPSNGLLYAPPHSCACYYQSKLYGFCALAPKQSTIANRMQQQKNNRLQKGPAYDDIEPAKSKQTIQDWLTYRHDAKRSGFTEMAVHSNLEKSWTTKLGTDLTPMVAANGQLFIAEKSDYTLHALDAATGERQWSFTGAGCVDSPPTIYQGRVLFGSADGYVYCLRASDGQLAWRYRAAPAELYHVAFDRVESVWPVHGSVLVQDDVVYAVAGRSMFTDKGLRLIRLDPQTGQQISETILDDRDPQTGNDLQTLMENKKMPVALPDILSSDGKFVYMRSQRFDLQGKRTKIEPEFQTDQTGDGIHLFSPIGFLDDTWFHRGYWIYGKNAGEGWGEWFVPGRLVPSGRLLVFDDDKVYGYARDPEYLCNSSILEYRLFAANKQMNPNLEKNLKKAESDNVNWLTRSQLPGRNLTAVEYKWLTEHPPLHGRAMTLCNQTLFVAGPPDIVDEKKARGQYFDPEINSKLHEQLDAWNGKKGALLWAVSKTDGQKIAEYTLDAPPIFDGMIAAFGKLYVVSSDGCITCFDNI